MTEARERLGEKIRDFVEDILSIDVVTLTGEINISIGDVGDGDKKINFEKLHANITGQLGGEVKVAAFTHVGLDKDTVQFVMESAADEGNVLLAHHRETVTGVQTARSDFFKAITGSKLL
ncbi:hypothetical protein [uncultured Ruegeria sp.]|uniref:hypothetical protein n=1 Tax=uncultured Ruegeria sp. TaxID=259304 RepID=UPI00260845DC|nr:hypothetical protein [uncultured Ruegeria sp.]